MVRNFSFLFIRLGRISAIRRVRRCGSLWLIILLICGCSPSKRIIVSNTLNTIPVITGSVVNSSAFDKGGTLFLGSFKPGTGAAANDETDQLSAMMIKGIKETLPAENTHFTIQTDNLEGSDCLLEGYIDNYGHEGHIPHLKLRKNQTFLSMDGEIWLRETGEKIFLFQTSAVIDIKTQNPQAVAYQIGVAIAHFIGSHAT